MVAKTEFFDLQEPKIQREDILVVKDKYFNSKNVAIVTGAASGIGRATAIALAVNGLTVIGIDINDEGGQETAKMAEKLSGKVIFIERISAKMKRWIPVFARPRNTVTLNFWQILQGLQHIRFYRKFSHGYL